MNGTPTAPELLEAARQGDNRACEQVLEENAGLIRTTCTSWAVWAF